MHRIGIDLGGTKIEGIVLDPLGRELFRRRIETRQEKGYRSILRRMSVLYGALKKKIRGRPHTLGIGTPGTVSGQSGLLKNSNTLCLNGKPFKQDLLRLLGRDFEIENDANCFALAEALFGAGRGKRLVFGVILGTGCGGGIVHEGKVWKGLQGISGEWGHMAIDPAGVRCYCGARGCVETLVSGGGLEKSYARRFGRRVRLPEIVRRFRAGRPREKAFLRKFFLDFGRSLANLINVLDPDIVVLGGGVSNIEELYTEGAAEVGRAVFSDSFETPIVRHRLGDSAGVLGAALVGR